MMLVPLGLIGPLGLPELLVIGGILVLLFGSRKLPELGSGMGRFVRNLKSGLNEKDKPHENSEKLEKTTKEDD